MGKLYLIPSSLGDTSIERTLPAFTIEIAHRLKHFVVENERSARRFLSSTGYPNIREAHLQLLNEHTSKHELSSLLDPVLRGIDLGLLSEAGCPGVADPGADLIALAHHQKIEVIPLVGPSSILLALMGSGLNGQQFTFHGYLPREEKQLIAEIKQLEQAAQEGATQIFIETPYRNNKLLDTLLRTLKAQSRLCIACDLTLPTEFLGTHTINEWKSQKPDINKRPTVFLIG